MLSHKFIILHNKRMKKTNKSDNFVAKWSVNISSPYTLSIIRMSSRKFTYSSPSSLFENTLYTSLFIPRDIFSKTTIGLCLIAYSWTFSSQALESSSPSVYKRKKEVARKNYYCRSRCSSAAQNPSPLKL